MGRRKPEAGWEQDVRAALPDGELGDRVFGYLRDGDLDLEGAAKSFAPNHNPSPGVLNARARFRLSDGLAPSVDPLLDLVGDLPDPVRARLGALVRATRQDTAVPAPDAWLSALLSSQGFAQHTHRTLAAIERAGVHLGWSAHEMAEVMFGRPTYRVHRIPAWLYTDFSPWVADHAALVRPYLAAGPADAIDAWEQVIRAQPDVVARFAPELAVAAASTSKNLRTSVEPAVTALGYAGLGDDLRTVVTGGAPAARAQAVAVLGRLVDAEERPALLEWLTSATADDRSKAVHAAVATVRDAMPSDGAGEDDGGAIALPVLDFDEPLSEQAAELIVPLDRDHWRRTRPVIVETIAANTVEGWQRIGNQLVHMMRLAPTLRRELTTVQLGRTLLGSASTLSWRRDALAVVGDDGHPDPLELQALAEHDGVDDATVVNLMSFALDPDGDRVPWPDADVAAWARRQLPIIVQTLAGTTVPYHTSRPGLIRALALIDPRPKAVTDLLVAIGLDGQKADRPVARSAVGSLALDQVVAALGSSKVAERTGAASWLRELRDPQTEGALRAAIDKEKSDLAKAQMLAALEATGASLDEYLAPDRLAAEAKAAMAKKNAWPKAIEWLSVDSLPEVRWNDGSTVDPVIFQWFIATAVKGKSAEPSPMLRRYTAEMHPADVARLGDALYETWVRHDLTPRPQDECEQIARQYASWKINTANRGGPYSEPYAAYKGLTVDQGMLLELPAILNEPAGSATDSKGLLAVVAAMGGPELVPRVHTFLKKWRGLRLSQGKTMLQMLAWMDTPTAIQVVLTVSQRFRPRGLQDEATRQAELLAERNGWTVEDLADRTVPRGGFDDDGRLVIDYGTRTFTAHLRDDLTVQLVNDESGKVTKTLPGPRQDEDAAEVKALQKDLTATKREVKAAATLQPDRLFAAMCVQRAWSADDFRRYLIAHPVMRRLAQRLVWVATTDDATMLFRPSSDGALIGIDDDEVELDEAASITVAHDELVDADTAARWADHLADYDVAPLFPQFGRPPVVAERDGTVIDDFTGHLISAMTLKGQANKFGWQLAPAEDGGLVFALLKDFRSGGLQAVLTVTGIPAYNDDHPAAIEKLIFTRTGARRSEADARPLREVPPILLREIYGEVAAIAAAGTGFDPDWQKKVQY